MKPLIVANWKMNPSTLEEAKNLFSSVARGIKNIKGAEVVICPPFVYLGASAFARQKASYGGSSVAFGVGGQDCFWEEKGAFTGEISPQMLKNLAVEYVIIGHSERRKYQKETDKAAEKKLKAALSAGLKPILCIDKISQLPRDIKHGFAVAYEPLFAIGTGKACLPERAEKMRLAIKKFLGPEAAVLYGGSVNARNAGDYIKKANFDGLLVGGASLNPKEFIDIIRAVC